MDRKKEFQIDKLKQYINPEMSQKAPEGFTSRVMSQISTIPIASGSRPRELNIIPLISVFVIILLTGMALLLPGSNSADLPLFTNLDKFRINLPDFDLTSFLRINLPSTLFYAFIGIFLLFLFDRALKQVFHSEN